MTCREKLMIQYPEKIDADYFGGCEGCPMTYNYLPNPEYCKYGTTVECTRCWDREIPETEPTKPNTDWENIKELIDDAMTKRDRSVSIYIYIHPENGISVNVYPWPDAEELYEMYKDGKITANDFREKMGLPRVETKGDFHEWNMLEKKLQIPTPEPKTYDTVDVPNTDDWN